VRNNKGTDMKKRLLGPPQIGLEVSELGLGCMGMSEFYGARDDATSLKVLQRALDLGVTFFDTADMYGHGHNEELIGRFLRDHKDRSVVVATKFGIVRDTPGYARGINNAPDYAAAACDASLRRLGVECIDLLYVHRLEPKRPIEEVMETLSGLVAAGKVKHVGLCEVNSANLRRAHAVHPVTAVQSEYSIWSRDPELGILQTCQELEIGFVPYAPLGRGFLTDEVPGIDRLDREDFRRRDPRFSTENFSRNLRISAAIAESARRNGCTSGQIALAWLLARAPNVVPIPGTRQEAHLRENCSAALVSLSDAEQMDLDSIISGLHVSGDRYPTEGMKGIQCQID
jgi:aryl-alcohol dehydrogenase-like predicted oxidoreductase